MDLATLDRAALLAMRTRLHEPSVERIVSAYSRLGEHGACWLLLGAIGGLHARSRQERARWARGAVVTGVGYGLNYAVKLTVRRPRPELPGLPALAPTVSRLSFPSAHATTSFAASAAYSSVAPPHLLYAAAILFALSRPYLGVHYPSDVLAGALLGSLVEAGWP